MSQPVPEPGERQRHGLAEISNALVRLHARHYGKGPNRARTYAFDNFVLCLLHEPYTTAELTLIAAGQEAAVRENRLLFYEALQDRFCDAVAKTTERRPRAFLPQVSIDPPVVSALFLFAE